MKLVRGIHVRACHTEERWQVLDIWRQAGVRLLATDTPEALEHLVERCPGSLLVADIDGQLAGTVIAGWDGWRGTIYRLAVVPRWRRRSVARTLVEGAIQYLREQGAQRVNLFVVADRCGRVPASV
jgi:ribosomal protein S18 acetylase RimI-like enzyme